MSYKCHSVAMLALCSALVFPATARAVDTRPGVIDRPAPEIKAPKSHALETKQAAPIKPAPSIEKAADGNKVIATVSQVQFNGLTVIPEEDLQKIAAPYLNRPFARKDLAELKYKLSSEFYKRGYILVKVVTPEQKLSSGVLKVDIYEAKVGDVNISNDGSLNQRVAEAFTKRVQPGDVFFERAVESVVSDLNDLGNVRSTLNLKPGKQFNTTDLTFNVSAAEDDTQRVTLDNYGSPLTGKTVAGAHFEKSNLLHLGETFSADLRMSHTDLWSANLGFKTPIALCNLVFETNYFHSQNKIGGRLEALGAAGKTDGANIALAKNLINQRNKKLDLRLGMEARTNESSLFDVTSSKDDIRQAFLESSYLIRTENGVYFATGRVTRGLDIFDANDRGDALATNAIGEPEAWVFEPTVYANILSPFSDGNFKFLANGQIASNHLLSSELFVLGGYGSVRGFEPAQEVGEGGLQFTAEYSHNLPSLSSTWDLKAGPFIDGGTVFNRVEGTAVDDHLYSAGIGIEATADLIKAGRTKIRLDWAHPLGAYVSNVIDDDTLYFRVSQNF